MSDRRPAIEVAREAAATFWTTRGFRPGKEYLGDADVIRAGKADGSADVISAHIAVLIERGVERVTASQVAQDFAKNIGRTNDV